MEYERLKEYMMKLLKRGLASNLYYHGIHHTIDVMRATEEIAKAEKIAGTDKTILMTAALFHDAGYLVRYKENEHISADICWKLLPHFGYTPSEISMIAQMIMSTAMPQSPKNKFDFIICDADLDYLGRDDFFIRGCNLRREWKEYGMDMTIRDWYLQQIDFLANHKYYTATSNIKRAEKKQKHLESLIKMLGK
ncbi:MAG: HD domain-containing protein [Bacteroidales bacterium]|nr:HD domain-containing protein [Bacteroidales bacterium]